MTQFVAKLKVLDYKIKTFRDIFSLWFILITSISFIVLSLMGLKKVCYRKVNTWEFSLKEDINNSFVARPKPFIKLTFC